MVVRDFIRVGIPLKEGGKSYVDAIQIGDYCLHKYYFWGEDPGGVWWAVTHIESGRKINPSELLFEYAVKMAEYLNDIDVKISESGECKGDKEALQNAIREIMMENLLAKEGMVAV